MAASILSTDTIDGSGFPLCFKVKSGTQRTGVLGLTDARDVFTAEARAMGGHQKEAVITEGAAGSMWRMVSDEGPGLKGTDLAPFPLGFMSAGLQADVHNRVCRLARARGIDLGSVETDLVNDYAFEGSFFKGDGRGYAYAPRFTVKVETAAPTSDVRRLIADAFDTSPILAAWRTPLVNTFALYTNGRRRALPNLPASGAPDAIDPLKAWSGVPRPLEGADWLPSIIEKAGAAETSPDTRPAGWQSGRVDIPIHGRSTMNDGITRSITWANRHGGSRFAISSDERVDTDLAPSGLALAFAGVAFCLMTQLLRYVEHHEMKVRALRLVQFAPCEMAGGVARGLPLDTHVFVHGEERDEVMERLIQMAANTCYLHAALQAALEPVVTLGLNGEQMPVLPS